MNSQIVLNYIDIFAASPEDRKPIEHLIEEVGGLRLCDTEEEAVEALSRFHHKKTSNNARRRMVKRFQSAAKVVRIAARVGG